MIAWLYDKTAHLGFNVIDEGLMAAYSHRILSGQVPHRDFISPRPVGSAILHIPDLAIPMPLYLAGRLVGITEVVVFSILLAWFIFRAPPWEWGPIRAAGAAASALINLHTFIETSWYTFDGLILVAAALLLTRAGLRDARPRLVAAGLLAAGLAVTTKQSFFAAPLLILGWVAWVQRSDDRAVRRLASSAAIAAAPIVVYVLVVAVLGGWSEMVTQLTGGKVVWGKSLLQILDLSHGRFSGRLEFDGDLLWHFALAAVALAAARVRPMSVWLRALLALLVVYLAGDVVFNYGLAYLSWWSLEVMVLLAIVLLVRIPFERRVDGIQLTMFAVGWMTLLSWGYELPALVAGSMALAIAAWAFDGLEPPAVARPAWIALATMVALGGFVYTAHAELRARERQPYFDVPARELTASVADVDHDFSGIRAGPAVASYMHGLKSCLRRYPAHWTTVIPDNPGLYYPMGLHNPFPIDWFWPDDYHGQRARLLQAARRVDARGDYLVLFQTVSQVMLKESLTIANATRTTQPLILTSELYDAALGRGLITALRGRHIVCASFLGVWSPRSG